MLEYRTPKYWTEATIGDVCSLRSGGTPSRKNPAYWNGDIPWIKTGEVDYCVISETEECITPLGLKESSANLFPKGTLLMAMYGQGVTRGKVAITGLEAATNQACVAITPTDSSQLTTDFLYWFLRYRYDELRSRSHGANQRNLSMTLIKIFGIAYPKLSVQKKIAHILSTVQRAIAAQERIIQTTTELKKALMHKLFTEGLRNEPQKQTEIGPVPESWEVVEFDLFSTLQRGKDLTKAQFQDGDIPVAGSNGVIGFHNTATCVGPGVTVGRSGSVGKVIFYDSDFWAHNTSLYVRDFHGNHPRYVAYFLEHLDLSRFKTGASVPTLDRNSFKNMPVPVPLISEQHEIAEALAITDRKTKIAMAKREGLRDLFRTLLHELMTAKIRVHELKFQLPTSVS